MKNNKTMPKDINLDSNDSKDFQARLKDVRFWASLSAPVVLGKDVANPGSLRNDVSIPKFSNNSEN